MGRKLIRPGLFSNVWLRAVLESRSASFSKNDRHYLRDKTTLTPDSVFHLIDRLAHLIHRLVPSPIKGWSGYNTECGYSVAESKV